MQTGIQDHVIDKYQELSLPLPPQLWTCGQGIDPSSEDSVEPKSVVMNSLMSFIWPYIGMHLGHFIALILEILKSIRP